MSVGYRVSPNLGSDSRRIAPSGYFPFRDIGITTYRNGWCSARLLELDPGERDNILILRQFKQHTVHRRIALQDVGQAVVRCVVQNVANDVRVNALCYRPLTGQARVFLSSSLSRLRVRNMSSSCSQKGYS